MTLPHLFSSGVITMQSWMQVRGTEEGFLGSWYGARVVEAREARGAIRLRLCYLAFQEDDGSFWEDWCDHTAVRPMPPEHGIDFIEGLKKGSPLEVRARVASQSAAGRWRVGEADTAPVESMM